MSRRTIAVTSLAVLGLGAFLALLWARRRNGEYSGADVASPPAPSAPGHALVTAPGQGAGSFYGWTLEQLRQASDDAYNEMDAWRRRRLDAVRAGGDDDTAADRASTAQRRFLDIERELTRRSLET